MNDILKNARDLILALPGVSDATGGCVFGFWFPAGHKNFPFVVVRLANPGRLSPEAPIANGIELEVRSYAASEAEATELDRLICGQITGAEADDYGAYLDTLATGGFRYINSNVLGQLYCDPDTHWIYCTSEYETEATL